MVTATGVESLQQAQQPRKLIAPVWHTIVVLLFALVPLVSGFIAQHQKNANNQIFASHSKVLLSFYVPTLIFEWLLVLFIWAGTRRRGVTLNMLIGGRWNKVKDFFADFGIGLALWIALLVVGAVLGKLLGPGHSKGSSIILPQGALEMLVWLAVSATAGFVEELAFRGYLQTQFVRMGLPLSGAVAAQAVIFSLGHLYEGWNAVILITVYALIFGFLAAWRKSLRPGILGHVVYDAVAPLLSRLG